MTALKLQSVTSQEAFEDHATQVFLYRSLEVPQFSKEEKDGWIVLTCDN